MFNNAITAQQNGSNNVNNAVFNSKQDEITREYLQQENTALLELLETPVFDIHSAAKKFEGFAQLEYISVLKKKGETLIAQNVTVVLPYTTVNPLAMNSRPSAIVTFVMPQDYDVKIKIRDKLCITDNTKMTSGIGAYGYVTQVNCNTITVRVTQMLEYLQRIEDGPVSLWWSSGASLQYAQRIEAIQSILKGRRYQRMLCFNVTDENKIPLYAEDDAISKLAESFAAKVSTTASSLNAEQQQAVAEIINPSKETFMLYGPPGTGKTSTLVEAIMMLAKLSNNRICVCTPSNKAADVIAEALLAKELTTDYLLRLYSKSVDPDTVSKNLAAVSRIQTDQNGRQYFAEIPYSYNYKVVVCTLGSMPRVPLKYRGTFSHLIVDEAGQAAELDIWLGLALLDCNSTKLILSGDPMQLGPVTTVPLLDDPIYGYKDSMLTRLMKDDGFRRNPKRMIQLTKNYRSHAAIVTAFSNIFYDNSLISTEPIGHDSLCQHVCLPKKGFPIVFKDVVGSFIRDIAGSSSNAVEADVVTELARSLLRSGIQPTDIGIVSPYNSQSDLIRKNLGIFNAITVESVEKYQGSERRVIIVTCVRNGGTLGFIEDRQRLNTAISRAQHMLIVVGHANSLQILPAWKSFIDYCKENSAFVAA